MKHSTAAGQRQATTDAQMLSGSTQLAAWLTGSSLRQLQIAPDGEQQAVRLAALTLVLISIATTLGWWVAMGIARAEYSLSNLPYAVMAGVLIYTIDRALLRNIWTDSGVRAAKSRGFRLPFKKNRMQLFIHAGLRISLSLILSFTTASFIELEIFRQDTSAYIKNQNLIQNREVVIDANRLIDTQINHTEKEIAKLNSDAKNVIEQSKIDQIALKSPIETQIKTLFVERELKQQRVEHLSEELDCQIINEGMEESGGIRCDGVLAIAGTQTKHRIAGELANHARAERALAQEEINRIDFEVKRLQGELKSLINDDVGQQQLNAIKSARVKALSELDTMLENRDKAVAVLSQENPAFVPMPDGLLIRGEALAALIDSSPWLAARVLLIMLSLVVLDLAAIFVISVQPAPGSLTMSEVLVSEVVIFESLAEAELAVFNAKRRILETREQATETENAVDQRVKSMEQERQMRRAVADQFERELAHC